MGFYPELQASRTLHDLLNLKSYLGSVYVFRMLHKPFQWDLLRLKRQYIFCIEQWTRHLEDHVQQNAPDMFPYILKVRFPMYFIQHFRPPYSYDHCADQWRTRDIHVQSVNGDKETSFGPSHVVASQPFLPLISLALGKLTTVFQNKNLIGRLPYGVELYRPII